MSALDTAKHEAGHLLVARAVGGKAHARLTLDDLTNAGVTTSSGYDEAERMTVLVAGKVAETNAWHPLVRHRKLAEVAQHFLDAETQDARKIRALLLAEEGDDGRYFEILHACERAADLLEEIGGDRIFSTAFAIERCELAEPEPYIIYSTSARAGSRPAGEPMILSPSWQPPPKTKPQSVPVPVPLAEEEPPDEFEVVSDGRARRLLRAAQATLGRKPKPATFIGPFQKDETAHVVSREPEVAVYLRSLPPSGVDDQEWASPHIGMDDGWLVSAPALSVARTLVWNEVESAEKVRG